MSSKSNTLSSDLYAAPLIFGFAPDLQLHRVAGDLERLSSRDRAQVIEIAKETASEAGSNAALTGMACRLEHGEAVLVGIPVDEVERVNGRPGRRGLSVAIGGVVSRVELAGPSIFVQLLAALDLAVARACAARYQNPIATATALTRCLQYETDDDRMIKELEVAVSDISTIFSLLVASDSNRSSVIARRKTLNATGSTLNNTMSEPAFALCHVLIEQLQSSGQNQKGRHFAIGTPNGKLLSAIERVSAHHFIGDGIILLSAF